MNRIILIFFLLFSYSNCNKYGKMVIEYEPIETYEVTLEEFIVYADIKETPLLEYIPDSIEGEFCSVLKEFAEPRGFDWRLILLLFYQESKLNPQKVGKYIKSYVGLAMFGKIAQKSLNVSREEILQMNHVEQAKLAIRMWEKTERRRKTKIDGFLALHVANFYPVWLPRLKKGGILPASDKVKKANYPLLMGEKEFTPQGLLRFYRSKVNKSETLKWFRGRF